MSEPRLVANTGKVIETAALRKFAATLIGEIIGRNDERYEQARRLWLGMIDPRRPDLILRCAATADVARSVDFCRSNELAMAVRAGGHSLAGDSFCDGGVVIDISGLKAIRVDPEGRTARAGAGLMAGELDRATQAFGLATVLGECSAVGIAGFTLGGGLGRLMGLHGAGSDNLLSAEVVKADSGIVAASAEENEELFWAIRGGGGNFGIVTSLEYQLHSVGRILGGVLTYPISQVREVLTFLDDYMMAVPDEFDVVVDIGNGGLMTFAPGVIEPILNLAVSYCGDLEKGDIALKPLRSFRRPLADTIRAMPYLEMQALSDIRPLAEFGSAGGSMFLEGGFIERLGAEAIETIVEYLTDPPPCFWFTAEHYLHGAICRPAPAQTAFGLRRAGYSFANFRGLARTESGRCLNGVGEAPLRRAEVLLRRSDVRELSDTWRRRGRASGLWRELRAPRRAQDEVRSNQLFQFEPQHRAWKREASMTYEPLSQAIQSLVISSTYLASPCSSAGVCSISSEPLDALQSVNSALAPAQSP